MTSRNAQEDLELAMKACEAGANAAKAVAETLIKHGYDKGSATDIGDAVCFEVAEELHEWMVSHEVQVQK